MAKCRTLHSIAYPLSAYIYGVYLQGVCNTVRDYIYLHACITNSNSNI